MTFYCWSEERLAFYAIVVSLYWFVAGYCFSNAKADKTGWLSWIAVGWPLIILFIVSRSLITKTWTLGAYSWHIPMGQGHVRAVKFSKQGIERNTSGHIRLFRWQYLGWGFWKERNVYGWCIPCGDGFEKVGEPKEEL